MNVLVTGPQDFWSVNPIFEELRKLGHDWKLVHKHNATSGTSTVAKNHAEMTERDVLPCDSFSDCMNKSDIALVFYNETNQDNAESIAIKAEEYGVEVKKIRVWLG